MPPSRTHHANKGTPWPNAAPCALWTNPLPTARTLIEHTYAQLRDDIVTGRLLPGEKLRVST